MRFHIPTHWPPHILWKYLCISSYIRKPFLIYDFAPDPIWIALYMSVFFFISASPPVCEDRRFREVGKLYFRKINSVTSAPFSLGKKNEKNVPLGISFRTQYIKEITPMVHQENVQPKRKYKFLLGCTYLYCTRTVRYLPNTYRKLKTLSSLHSVKFTYRYLSFWQRVAVVALCSVFL